SNGLRRQRRRPRNRSASRTSLAHERNTLTPIKETDSRPQAESLEVIQIATVDLDPVSIDMNFPGACPADSVLPVKNMRTKILGGSAWISYPFPRSGRSGSWFICSFRLASSERLRIKRSLS